MISREDEKKLMKKMVITGFSGFVASHFMDYLYENNLQFEIYGISIGEPSFDYNKYQEKLYVKFFKMDLLDGEKINLLFAKIRPDYVLHLAAFSSVAYSWKHPEDSFTNNCNIFLNLVAAVKKSAPNCRILSVGSSEEYGNVASEDLPIRENQVLCPISPYAVARVSQEQLSKVYVAVFGMKIIMTRSFNHIGPRQDERFVVPSFIKRILEIKNAGFSEGEIETGDLTIIRDFVDVRDVVDAYYRLLMDGKVGEVYNICSGEAISLSSVVDEIAQQVNVKIRTRTNPLYMRPNDNHEIVGSSCKIESEIGWKRRISFRDTIRDMIAYEESRCL